MANYMKLLMVTDFQLYLEYQWTMDAILMTTVALNKPIMTTKNRTKFNIFQILYLRE